LGTQIGDLALWEAEALKVHKIISIPAHKEFHRDSEHVKEEIPITAIAWKHYGNLLVTGDNRGLIQYCDETFRNVFVAKEAHAQAVRGLTFAPLDSKMASCSDDGKINLWSIGYDKPDKVLLGHQSDIKCVDWHPFRGLIASGSRDSTVRLWDPRLGQCVSTITAHKKQVSCCQWNLNGNWLATGSTDGLIKLFDLRNMREMETLRGQNSEVCRLAWHPVHESLLVSGGYSGNLVYWIVHQHQSPHSRIEDAHRQSIDLIAWHPSGHLLATASHDAILKFWCREPVGSNLEPLTTETAAENLPTYYYGPLQAQKDVEAMIANKAHSNTLNSSEQSAGITSSHMERGGGDRGHERGHGGGRRGGQGQSRKRSHQEVSGNQH